MRPSLFSLALAVLLGLSGCRDEEPFTDPPICFPEASSSLSGPSLLLVGEPVRLPFHGPFLIEGRCEAGRPTSATSEVYDSDGVLVPSTVVFEGPNATPILHFVPERPGSHHILVLFSPVGGLLQFDIQVAVDRSTELPRHSLPEACQSLERTLNGTWVCDSGIHRGGSLVEQFDGARLAVAGNVVWVVEFTRLRRFEDTGTALVLTASLNISSGPAEFLLATPDELLVLHASTLTRYTASGGSLQASPSAIWSGAADRLGTGLPRALLLREGDRLAVVSRINDTVQACPYQLTPEGPVRTPASCQKILGMVVGFEPSVLWEASVLSLEGGGPLRRWEWTGGELREQGMLYLSFQIQLIPQPLDQRSAAVPVVRAYGLTHPLTAVVTWSPARRVLLFEHLDGELGTNFASPSLYWGSPATPETNVSTRIRVRSSAP